MSGREAVTTDEEGAGAGGAVIDSLTVFLAGVVPNPANRRQQRRVVILEAELAATRTEVRCAKALARRTPRVAVGAQAEWLVRCVERESRR